MHTTFIQGAGAAIVSRKIVERTGNIKWLTREEPFAPQDSGWRVLSDRDTTEYLDDPKNMPSLTSTSCATLSPPASASTTCPSAPTFNSSSSLTDVGDGSITRPRKRFPSAD